MSYAAFKIKHLPTGIETCASGNITHISADLSVQIPPIQPDDTEWSLPSVAKKPCGPLPNLVVTAGNVLEIYDVRVKEEDEKSSVGAETKGVAIMDGITGACLELVCHYRLHGNVESMAILSTSGDGHRRRDSIVLAFKDSKISILEYDDSVCGLRTSSMHCFEGPEWNYLKRGRESFAHGPEVRTDSQGRCAAVLVYDLQMIILNASQYGQVFVSDDETTSRRGSLANCIESSYIVNLRELEMKHIKDFIFVHGYIEPVMVILHELELTWAGRTSWKHHTCMISAHSISTALKQHPLIWSASNLPHDAYKLFAVPSPIGGVLVICANSIHYHSQNSSSVLGVNNFFASGDDSSNIPKTNFSVELDAANASWLSHDILMFSAKNGVILLLTLVYDGRMVNKLELSMAKISVLTSGITTIGNKFFFLASRLGDSILVQYNCGTSTSNSSREKDEVADAEGDVPPAKRLCMASIDGLEDISSTDELSLCSSHNSSLVSTEKNFSFLVRDSLVNIGPLRDFSYGLRINADPNATGIAKQSNYELALLEGVGRYGPGYTPPLPQQIAGPILNKEVLNIDELRQKHEVEWAKRGCTLMSDGWTDRRGRSIINFLLNSAIGTFYLKSIDCTTDTKTGEFIANGLSEVIDQIGSEKIIQVCTDNASNYVLAGGILMDKYPHLFWTPCAAHVLDLALEDIGSDPNLCDDCAEFELAFSDCVERMISKDDVETKVKIYTDVCLYKERGSRFGGKAATNMAETTHPLQWWDIFGVETVELRKLARRILSLCASASSCERNWSTFAHVCCSGHGKNGALCILQQSIRPELITEVELAGCKGIWTVYHKSGRNHVTDSKVSAADDEYHAYLIISLESRTMVLETADLLGEVTESVDYFVQGSTIAAGNLFGRRRVVQVFKHGARILDGSYMTQEIFLGDYNSDNSSTTDCLNVVSASIADPYVLVKISDGSIQLLVGDPSTCTVSVNIPVLSGTGIGRISACTLYHDKGPDPWLRKTSTDAWLSTGISDIDSSDGALNDQGDIYCLVCYEGGTLEFFEVSNFKCVFSVKNFMSGKKHLVDAYVYEPSMDSEKVKDGSQVKTESGQNLKILEVSMHKWSGQHSRPFLFVLLNDGTMFCYHAFLYESNETQDNMLKIDDSLSSQNCADRSTSRLRNLKFVRVTLNGYIQDYSTATTPHPRFTVFENIRGYHGIFVAGSRPTWFMVCRERLRIHPQLCDGSILAFTVLHNVNCNHGLIYVTSQGFLKICQLPSAVNYDNYWPVQKIPLRATPHQITYFAERNLYPVIVSISVDKPINQIISSLTDQETSHQPEQDNSSSDSFQKYATDEFEIRILEPEKSSNSWETKATIPMQTSENALTIRMVSLLNSESKENETLLAIGTAYTQGEDIAGRGRVMLFSFRKKLENSQNLVSEVYSKELKGAISALSSLQGHLLVASGPKITLFKWTGTELNGVAFFDAPPLHAVSMNIVKNFILLGDIHKSIYFLNWKEQGAQLTLLAKDFGSLDCYATEFLIDGSTLSLVVSDNQKNIQIFYYAPKMSESWKGQKLLTRAEFHAGALVTKFMRLQMLSVSPDKTNPSGSEKTNRFALLFGTLDGSIGCVAPLDEITFRRLQTLQRKLVEAIPHVCGLNPRAFRQFHSCGKPHRPGPDNIVDFELLSHYEMLTLEEQLEIAQQSGTTRPQILSNLNDFSVGTSFL